MPRTIAILVLALSLCGGLAARDLELVEGAYELSLRDIVLPQSAPGSATFRTCSDCQSINLPVDAATRYYVGGRALPLRDFLDAVEEIRRRDGDSGGTVVGVFYDLKTKRITHIDVQARRP